VTACYQNIFYFINSPGRRLWELMPWHSVHCPSGINFFL